MQKPLGALVVEVVDGAPLAGDGQLAQLARVNHFFQNAVRVEEPLYVPDGKLFAAFFLCLEHFVALRDGVCHRLFDQYVKPVLEEKYARLAVQKVREVEDYGGCVGFFGDFTVVQKVGHTIALRRLARLFLVRVANGAKAAPVVFVDSGKVRVTDNSGSHNSNFNHFHSAPLNMYSVIMSVMCAARLSSSAFCDKSLPRRCDTVYMLENVEKQNIFIEITICSISRSLRILPSAIACCKSFLIPKNKVVCSVSEFFA